VEDFFMANFEWKQVSPGAHQCGEWAFAVTGGWFFIDGPSWFTPSRVGGFPSFAAVEEEIQNQIDERRAALAESKGQEYQAWCRG
jgi:hypothetical protein